METDKYDKLFYALADLRSKVEIVTTSLEDIEVLVGDAQDAHELVKFDLTEYADELGYNLN